MNGLYKVFDDYHDSALSVLYLRYVISSFHYSAVFLLQMSLLQTVPSAISG